MFPAFPRPQPQECLCDQNVDLYLDKFINAEVILLEYTQAISWSIGSLMDSSSY